MALRFVDSFDHYATANIFQKWTSGNTANGSTITTGGRNSTSRARFQHSFDSATKVIDAQATWIIGFAFSTSTSTGSSLYQLVGLTDASGGVQHFSLGMDSGGHLVARRGNVSGTTLGTGTIVLSQDTFYFIEVKVTISDASGVVVVKVNGVTDINLSSQDTRNGGNATADSITLSGGGQNNNFAVFSYDDLYICDTSGGSPTNDFLGDVRVEALLPNGNGNSSQLVGSDGNSTDNYLLVDESTPNSDTDYVESSTVNDKDTYAFGNMTSTSGTVYGVQVLPFAKKTDAGTRSIKSVARLSATEADSADKTLTSAYLYLPDIRETKPGGGSWSISDVNSAEFGVKVSA